MDDLFFTDDNKDSDSGKKSHHSDHSSQGQFISDMPPVNSDTQPEDTPKEAFKVKLPGEAGEDFISDSVSPATNSRTPKGRPVSSGAPYTPPVAGYNNQSRTPSGSPVANTNQRQTPQDVQPKRKQTKRVNGKKIAVAVIALLLVLLCGIGVYGYSLLGKISYDTQKREENQYISQKELASSSNVKNILFIGSDNRSDVSGMRSDTMMLFSIDKKNKKIKLTSFLRDSYVYLPNQKRNRKLNAACNSGAGLVLDTIEYNFKVKIDNYILVDFEAFKKLIDLMGGLTVKDVTEKEAKYLRDVVKIPYAKEGTNKFTGGATLWYCRIRYLDDDFHRTQRQRKVITAIIDQLTKTNPATLVKIMQEVLPMISTDITRNELVSLGVGAVTSYLRYDIEQAQVPAEGTWSNLRVSLDGLVLKMDIEKNAKLLKEFLYSEEKSAN